MMAVRLENRARVVVLAALLVAGMEAFVPSAEGQMLRFGNHREITIPDYATVRIGPFYSTAVFSQSVGARYTRSEGAGTDFLYDNKRGRIVEDGWDVPLVSTLDFRNYLIVTRRSDLDMSVSMTYEHYPLGTQEDDFSINLAEEGIYGDFTTEVILTPYLKCHLYDSAVYKTDYVDTRGLKDVHGGSRYEYFANTVGANLDWLMAEDKNLALSVSRTDNLPREDEFKDQERVSYSETLAYEQQLTVSWMAGVSAGFGQNTYPAASNRPDSASQTYSIFTSARLTERSTGNATVGYSLGSVDGETDPDEGTMVGSLGFKTQLSESLAHGFGYSRAQRAGFNSAFEVSDAYSYNLQWKGELNSAALYSGYSTVDPRQEGLNAYSDWVSGANLSVPIYVGMILTDYVTLMFAGSYSDRTNEEGLPPEETEIEWNADYSTWAWRVGTSFPLYFKDVAFSMSYEHIERMSDSDLLPYTRDTAEASLRYTHQF